MKYYGKITDPKDWVTKEYVDGKIPAVPAASTSSPLMDGTATYGSGTAYARSDHRHPTDTTRVAVAQGAANKGKFLVVGNDGNVTLATINSAGGVSF